MVSYIQPFTTVSHGQSVFLDATVFESYPAESKELMAIRGKSGEISGLINDPMSK